MGIRNRINNEYVGARDWMHHDGLDQFNAVDDRVQRYARQTYDDAAYAFGDSLGGVPHDVLRTMGQVIHGDRRNMEIGDLIATRGLQAGGLTAAGVGLANLTQRMAETFGGTGDTSGSDTLYM